MMNVEAINTIFNQLLLELGIGNDVAVEVIEKIEGHATPPGSGILTWQRPMNSATAARYLMTRGLVAVELYDADNARLKALLIEAGEVGQHALLALGSLAHRCNDDDAYPETRAALASLLAKIDAVK